MRIALDDEWYWLREIARRIAENQEPSAYDVWAQIVLPALLGVATLALAFASVYIGVLSHQTSVRAAEAAETSNELTKRFKEEDRKEVARRSRMRLVAPLEHSYLLSVSQAIEGTPQVSDPADDDAIRLGAFELDAERDQLGRLRAILQIRVDKIREDYSTGDDLEDLAFLTAGSRLITDWARDPSALDEWTAQAARIRALQTWLMQNSTRKD